MCILNNLTLSMNRASRLLSKCINVNNSHRNINNFTWPLKDEWSYDKFRKCIESSIDKPHDFSLNQIVEDPHLIGSDNFTKKTCGISYEFGRNAADNFIYNNIELMKFRQSNPIISKQNIKKDLNSFNSVKKNIFIIEKLLGPETIYEAISVAINTIEKDKLEIPDELVIKVIDNFFYYQKKKRVKRNESLDNVNNDDFVYPEKLLNLVQNKSSDLYEVYIVGLLNNEFFDEALKIFDDICKKEIYGTPLLYSTFLRSLSNIYFDDKLLLHHLKTTLKNIEKFSVEKHPSIMSAFVSSLPHNAKESYSILLSVLKDFSDNKIAFPIEMINNSLKILQIHNKNFNEIFKYLISMLEERFPLLNYCQNEGKGILEMFKICHKQKMCSLSTSLIYIINKWDLWNHLTLYVEQIIGIHIDLLIINHENPLKIFKFIESLSSKSSSSLAINFTKLVDYVESTRDMKFITSLILMMNERYPTKMKSFNDRFIRVFHRHLNKENCQELLDFALKYIIQHKTNNIKSDLNIDLESLGSASTNFLLTSFAMTKNLPLFYQLKERVQNIFTPDIKCYVNCIQMEAESSNIESFKKSLRFVGSIKNKQILNNISIALNSIQPSLSQKQKDSVKEFLVDYEDKLKMVS